MQNTGFARKGFTLVELLVVIAIIAVLAAILFPTFGFVREKTRQTQCISQMQAIHTAVGLYKEDNGKYPASLYLADTLALPADMRDARNRPLYQYSKDKDYWVCPDNVGIPTTAVTNAVYPPGIPLSGTVKRGPTNLNYYKADSYDLGLQVDKNGNAVPGVYELHYSLDWTGVVSAGDAKNQLKYPNPPPDLTVITWCTYHAATAHANVIPVLMLSGTAKPMPINKVVYDPAQPAKPYLPLNFKY